MAWNGKALGLAGGVLWGAIMLLGTLIVVLTDGAYAGGFFDIWMSIYPGYTFSWLGVLLGGIYGFIDGFIGGWLLAWLYNKFA